MKVSKWVVVGLLTILMLGLIVTSASAQSSPRETTPTQQVGGIVIVPPPAHKKSDCNKNGIDDLDEFWPPDCWLAGKGGD